MTQKPWTIEYLPIPTKKLIWTIEYLSKYTTKKPTWKKSVHALGGFNSLEECIEQYISDANRMTSMKHARYRLRNIITNDIFPTELL